MSTEVGQGHIDIEPRIDDKAFVRQSRALTQTAEKQWGLYAKNAARSLRETDQQFQTSMNKQLSSWQALDRQRQKAFADRAKGTQAAIADIQRMTVAKQKMHDSDIKAGAKAAAEYERSQMAAFDRITAEHAKSLSKMENDRSKVSQRITTDVDRHSRKWGDSIAFHMGKAFEAGISILPGRLEGLFTKTGPVIGTALAVGIFGGLVVALPALGAMLSGAIFAALGFGAIAGAVAIGILDDPRVKSAAGKFAETFKQEILYALDTQIIGQRLASAIDIGTARMKEWSDTINSILVAASTKFDDIANAISDAVVAILQPLDRFVNSDFFDSLIQIALEGFVGIAEVFGTWMDDFMNTPEAVEGAKLGFKDFFDVLLSGLRGTLEMFTALSVKWNEMNTDPDGPMGPKKSTIDALKDLKSTLEDIISLLNMEPNSNLFKSDREGSEGKSVFAGAGDRFMQTNLGQGNTIQTMWSQFANQWNAEMGVARRNWDSWTQGVATRWNEVMMSLKGAWTGFTTWLSVQWEGVKQRWNGMTESIKGAWNNVWVFAVVAWTVFYVFISTWWEDVKLRWNGVTESIKGAWNNAWEFIKGVWGVFVAFLYSWWGDVKARWNSMLESIKGAWNTAIAFLSSVWDTFATWISGKWEELKAGWSAFTSAISSIWSSIWVTIQNAAADGINGIIDILNDGIHKINDLLGKIGVDKKIPDINHVGYAGVGSNPPSGDRRMFHADGGRIYGPGTGTSDDVPAVLSNGEFVIRTKAARALGYQNLSYMNAMGRVPGFAAGGRVGGENEGLLQEHANHLHVAMDQGWQYIIALAAQSGIPNSPGSTVRPGDTTASGNLSWHSSGKAVDFMGYNQDALANFFMGVPGVLELIHRTAIQDYTIFGGKGGGGSSFLVDVLTKGIDHFLNPIIDGVKGKLPDNAIGWIMGGAFGRIAEGAKGMVESFMATFREMLSGGGGGGGAGQWSGVASHALSLLGLPGSWLGPLLTLIDRESGGNPNAINNWDSNAAMGDPSRGLMQTIGSTFNAHRLPSLSADIYDPLSNIVAGLRYIQSKYGSIFNVQQAVGSTPAGYDNGGPWASGTLGVNESGRTEMVLTGAQADALERRIEGGDGPTIYVLIDGVEVAYRAVIEESNNQVSRGFRGGRK